ncbi:MAG: DUF3795 domain-containing protein [Thermoprotei archaeon]
MPRVNGVLYGYCGLLCEYCKAYLAKECPGCDAHADQCEFIKCAREKNVKICLACRDFPCQLHKRGFTWYTEEYGKLQWRVYSDVFIRIFEELKQESK